MDKLVRYDRFAFALIIFGRLGKSAKLSLDSILSTGVSRVCIAGDKAGMEWIENQISESKKGTLCQHEIPRDSLLQLELDWTSVNEYSSFGKERFIKLTTFKWYLLKNVLDTHELLDYVVFSDLDVFWMKHPSANHLKSRSLRQLTATIQDDTPVGAKARHFCTGIMYWSNSSESKRILGNLYDIQFFENARGNLTPDEPTFNDWFRSMDAPLQIDILNQNEFVIGHRFFRLLISDNLEEVTAIHANYVVGEKAKYRRLRSIELRMNQDPRWLFYFFRELVIRVFQKFFKVGLPR